MRDQLSPSPSDTQYAVIFSLSLSQVRAGCQHLVPRHCGHSHHLPWSGLLTVNCGHFRNSSHCIAICQACLYCFSQFELWPFTAVCTEFLNIRNTNNKSMLRNISHKMSA